MIKSVDESGKFLWSKHVKQDLGLKTEHFKKIFSDGWLNVTRGYIDTRDHLDKIFSESNIDLSADIFIDYWLSHDGNIDVNMIGFVKDLISHKVPVYIGTNQDKYRTTHIRNLLSPYFNGLFSSTDIGFIKPEPGFYNHISLTLDLPPKDILLIDDTMENIQGACAQGWNTHHYV